MNNITEMEKRLDKMSATFEELKDGILRLKSVKSEYSQAAIILLRKVFIEREQRQYGMKNNFNLLHVSNSGCKCPFCGEEMKGIELTHYKCKKCNEYFTN